MFRICLTLSFVLMISYLETTPSITLPWIWSYESFIPGLNICNLVTGKPSFTKKQADLFFPPDFADDFPVAMQVSATPFSFSELTFIDQQSLISHKSFKWQISHKYSLIYAITKLGLLFVYDLETATAVYRNRISPDPIFLTAEASTVGGFYAINRRGQVLLATVNEAMIVPFVSGQVCSYASFLSL